jgi:hypothetical protein
MRQKNLTETGLKLTVQLYDVTGALELKPSTMEVSGYTIVVFVDVSFL